MSYIPDTERDRKNAEEYQRFRIKEMFKGIPDPYTQAGAFQIVSAQPKTIPEQISSFLTSNSSAIEANGDNLNIDQLPLSIKNQKQFTELLKDNKGNGWLGNQVRDVGNMILTGKDPKGNDISTTYGNDAFNYLKALFARNLKSAQEDSDTESYIKSLTYRDRMRLFGIDIPDVTSTTVDKTWYNPTGWFGDSKTTNSNRSVYKDGEVNLGSIRESNPTAFRILNTNFGNDTKSYARHINDQLNKIYLNQKDSRYSPEQLDTIRLLKQQLDFLEKENPGILLGIGTSEKVLKDIEKLQSDHKSELESIERHRRLLIKKHQQKENEFYDQHTKDLARNLEDRSTAKSQIESLNDTIGKLNGELADKKSQIDSIKEQLKRVEESGNTTSNQYKELQSKYSDLNQELSNLTTERNRLNLELANTQSISAINNITNRIKQQGLEASNQRLTGKVQDLSNQVQSYQKELLNRVTQLDGWKYLSTDKQTEIIRKINEGDPTYDPTKEITVPVSGEELSKAFGRGETLNYVKDVMSQTYQQHPGMVISGTVLGTLLLAYGGYKAYRMWKNYRERKKAEKSVASE